MATFEKKSYLYSENMGVCQVEDVTRLVTARKQEVYYYVLRSVYRRDKTAYIPVEGHTVELRELISTEEAEKGLFEDTMLEPLARELGYLETTGDEETDEKAEPDLTVEKEEEKLRLALQYKMADTLPFEERSRLYHRGEIEFVLRKSREGDAGKKKRRTKENGRKGKTEDG